MPHQGLLVSYFARNEQAFVHLGRLADIRNNMYAEIHEAFVLGTLSHAMHLKIKPAVGS